MNMTPEEFLEYIGEAKLLSRKGKGRLAIARNRYRAYRLAHRVQGFAAAYYLHLNGSNHYGIIKGLRDRDEGKPVVLVQEFEPATTCEKGKL